MMSSGRTHLAAKSGDGPPDGWEVVAGWRRGERFHEGQRIDLWFQQGTQIGWMDKDTIYLLPPAAVSEAERFEHTRGITLGLDVAHVGKRLRDSKMLLGAGEGRTMKQVRIGKMLRWCWVVSASDWLEIAIDGDGKSPNGEFDIQGDSGQGTTTLMQMDDEAVLRQEALAKERRKRFN
jgi:hypothetical protein